MSEVTDVGKHKVLLMTTGLKISTKAKAVSIISFYGTVNSILTLRQYAFVNLGSASKAINLIKSLCEKAKKGSTQPEREESSEGAESPNLEHFSKHYQTVSY